MPLSFTFLMCSERSGSNLITRMFDAHPDCCGPSPTHLVRILAENRGRYGDLSADGPWRELCSDAAEILATKVGRWQREWTAADLQRAVPRRSLAAPLRTVFAAEAKSAGKAHLFIKENHLHRSLPLVQRAFPGARIVAMVRDPRDMALSWQQSDVLRGGVVRAARVWRADQDALLQVLNCLVRGRDIHLLRYEDLVSAPGPTLDAACAFVGLPPDPAMLDFHREDGATVQASSSEAWRNLDRPLMSGNFHKWRDGLTPDQLTWVEAVCSGAMEAFGYRPETSAPADLAGLEARLTAAEPWDKPGWARVSAAEQAARRRRETVVGRIAARPLVPHFDLEPAHA